MQKDKIFAREEKHKELVYQTFNRMRREVEEKVQEKEKALEESAFEQQLAQLAYSALTKAKNDKAVVENIVKLLWEKPYFNHIEIQELGEISTEHYYLSDLSSLDESINIDGNGVLLPFKKDPDRPLYTELFRCSQHYNGEIISYMVNHKEKKTTEQFQMKVKLICEDKIKNKKLLEVIQKYPLSDIDERELDTLFEQRLRENRNSPFFKNIIATLKEKQFEIIDAKTNESFIVQGCAGSGKSQCLFHRLFYLRAELSDKGWDKVLLITPTKLFNLYSAELVRRYKLTNIKNYSIAELYQNLLNTFDERFKNRQYEFELTEEYLPDDYLKIIYNDSTIEKLEKELERAIRERICPVIEALNLEKPEQINATFIQRLMYMVDEEIQVIEQRNEKATKDPICIEQKQNYEKAKKELQKKIGVIDKLFISIKEEETFFKKLKTLEMQIKECMTEKKRLVVDKESKIEFARLELSQIREKLNANKKKVNKKTIKELIQVFYNLDDLLNGNAYVDDRIKEQGYDKDYIAKEKELEKLLNGKPVEKVKDEKNKKIANLRKRIDALELEKNDLIGKSNEHLQSLKDRLSNLGFTNLNNLEREEDIKKAKVILSRLVSDIFEKEVWDSLAPIKERYNVKMSRVEQLEESRKEIKILYKSDLLFYLKIYEKLYSNSSMPDYQMICIDEGQDLHKADYNIIKKLFPNATMNIFGDLNQVLHTECGIKEWKAETGISKLYELNHNYRNTASIVEFCNQQFGSKMQYIGVVNKNDEPQILMDSKKIQQLIEQNKSIVVIVKDKNSFEDFCLKNNLDKRLFHYLDTRAENMQNNKVNCFSIFAAKGLEFNSVLVYTEGMTKNQKVVACTRAMEKLYLMEDSTSPFCDR